MISIKPFKAIRPTRDKAPLVASRSYVTYSDEELDARLKHNPYTFLHIINPEKGRKLKPGGKKYKLVKEAFDSFMEDGIFMRDNAEGYYLYRQVKEGNEYIGLIAAVAVKDYLEGRIKKHEKTLTEREKMFTDYLEATGFNAEPVLLTYRDDIRLNKIFARYFAERAEYEFTSIDRVLHQLWVINEPAHLKMITEVFGEQSEVYIADGHHRCSSSSLLANRISAKGAATCQDHEYFMAFFIGEEQMKVYDFNRLVKGTNGKRIDQILTELREKFLVEPVNPGPFRPEKLHEMSMYVNNRWYKLVPRTGTFDPQDPIDHLDAEILSKNILAPIFGIKNLKADKRIGFLPGTEGVEGLLKCVDEDEYDIAFGLYPVSVEQIKAVADADLTMPPKSTYIEPKLRSGLTIYEILS